jgi:hypothetical protein
MLRLPLLHPFLDVLLYPLHVLLLVVDDCHEIVLDLHSTTGVQVFVVI